MEDNANQLRLCKKVKAQKKSGGPDIKAVQSAVAAYFENNGVISIPGLCLSLDITKETLFLWEAGFLNPADKEKGKGYCEELSLLIKKALLKIEQQLLESDGKNRMTKDMAVLKRYYGYGDKAGEDGGRVEIDLGVFDEFSR